MTAGLERLSGANAWKDVEVRALNELAYLPFDGNLRSQVAKAAETLECYRVDIWRESITMLELEAAHRELRTLVQFMDRSSRNAVVMDVKDELVEPEEFALLTVECWWLSQQCVRPHQIRA